MKLTTDEQRALSFIAALLLLSAAVRMAALPEPMAVPESAGGFDADTHLAATERAVAERERRSTPLARGERLDPNTAPAAELDRLPGVGPALAERIVATRTESPFRSASELTRVPGVGERTAERLAPWLDVSAPTSSPGAAAFRRATGRPGGASDVVDRGGAGVVDLNSAPASALVALSGVGPVLAERIVAYRDSAGPFPAVDSLVAVPGIGPATLARIRSRVRVR